MTSKVVSERLCSLKQAKVFRTVPNAGLPSRLGEPELFPFIIMGADICSRGLSGSEVGVLLRPPVKKLKIVEWLERLSPSFDADADSDGGKPGDGGPVSMDDIDSL